MQNVEILSKNTVFRHIGKDELRRVSELAISRVYSKGQWITFSGEVWPYLFIVHSGKVNAIKESSEGRSLIITTLGQGEVFWGLAFFQENAPMPVSLRAIEESRILMWSQDRLLPIILRNGEMSWELSRLLVSRMQRASEIVDGLAFQPNAGRLARLLLEHYEGAVGEYVNRDMTLDEMSSRIGTTREVVCRLLNRFSEDGTIQIKRTEFMIMDREKLIEHAEKVKG